MNNFKSALGLLTIAPVDLTQVGISARALAWYPVIGLLIGVLLVVSNLILRSVFTTLVASALVVALWAVLTGGLHLDGLADACDALFAATTRERRLEILRDVHIGAFGATGLVLVLLLKFAAVASLNSNAALLLAPLLARWSIVYASAYPMARREGMAVLFTNGLGRRDIFLAILVTSLATVFFGWFGVAAFVASVLTTTLIARLALARLGGLTGDIYGMVCESVEVAVLLVGTVVR